MEMRPRLVCSPGDPTAHKENAILPVVDRAPGLKFHSAGSQARQAKRAETRALRVLQNLHWEQIYPGHSSLLYGGSRAMGYDLEIKWRERETCEKN